VSRQAQPPVPPRVGGGRHKVSKKRAAKWRDESIYDAKPVHKNDNDLDLESYLVEREEVKVNKEVDTQTDTFAPLPAEKPYIPAKRGIDASTQMTEEDQPFHFDRDVAPLLEVLVGKTIEQSLLEVEQEEEIQSISQDLERLLGEKVAENEADRQREQETIDAFIQKEKHKSAQRQRLREQAAVRQKVAALRLMKQVWPELQENASRSLESIGRWRTPVTHVIRSDFLPWLYQETDRALQQRHLGEQLLDDMLVRIVAEHEDRTRPVCEERRQAREAAEAERKEREGRVRIFLQASSLGLEEDQVVGPIKVSVQDSIKDVEDKIAAWLQENGIQVTLPAEGLLHLALNGRELSQDSKLLDEQVEDNAKLEVLLPQAEGGEGAE